MRVASGKNSLREVGSHKDGELRIYYNSEEWEKKGDAGDRNSQEKLSKVEKTSTY
jgi:hypothetical protein